MTSTPVLGVLGGSGLYDIPGLAGVEEVRVETPFGPPSDAIVRGRLGATVLLFLPRHGRGHRIPPHQIDARANICALKKLGATHLVGISAVGSMKEEIAPGDFVVVDQFIDLTKGRPSTFFTDGIVGHVGFADPVCEDLSKAVAAAAGRAGARVHAGGTYVCIEGPQFSTRAESLLYRSWGVSVIGMTALPEAKLAREAELCYAVLAFVTDYDVWHSSAEAVTVEMVIKNLAANIDNAKRIVRAVAPSLAAPPACACGSALRDAIMTAPERIPAETRQRLGLLIGRYLAAPDLSPGVGEMGKSTGEC